MVKTGLEILLHSRLELLQGRRVGLVTHPPAVLPDYTHALDALLNAGVRLSALFGPEHGFDASAADGATVADSRERRTGLPVYSLYGPVKEPTPAMLQDVDALLVDLQDVGVRFYTFTSTLYYVLHAAAAAGKPVIVLDRPNPIGGLVCSGPPLEADHTSFVGIASMPVRHGLTLGELARYFNTHFDFRADLTVIPMQGWQRGMWFDRTGLPWTPLSPGMPTLSTACVYPGMCFLEGTALSEGRGTGLPFETAGAPWLDGWELAAQLNALGLAGVRFRALNFMPTSSKHAGQTCQGVQVHVCEREKFEPFAAALHLLAACLEQTQDQPFFLESSWEGHHPHFDLLAGSPHLRQSLSNREPVAEIVRAWQPALAEFEAIRREVMLYPEQA